MDLDAFVAVHSPEWERLDTLARRRRLSGAEADELPLADGGEGTAEVLGAKVSRRIANVG